MLAAGRWTDERYVQMHTHGSQAAGALLSRSCLLHRHPYGKAPDVSSCGKQCIVASHAA